MEGSNNELDFYNEMAWDISQQSSFIKLVESYVNIFEEKERDQLREIIEKGYSMARSNFLDKTKVPTHMLYQENIGLLTENEGGCVDVDPLNLNELVKESQRLGEILNEDVSQGLGLKRETEMIIKERDDLLEELNRKTQSVSEGLKMFEEKVLS